MNNNILNIIGNLPGPFFFIKIGFLVLLFGYIIFAFVILNQVISLNKIITIKSATGFNFYIALLHLLVSVSLFIVGLVIL